MHIDHLVVGCQLSHVPNCLVQHTQSFLDMVVVVVVVVVILLIVVVVVILLTVVVVVILLTVVVSPFESNLEWE